MKEQTILIKNKLKLRKVLDVCRTQSIPIKYKLRMESQKVVIKENMTFYDTYF